MRLLLANPAGLWALLAIPAVLVIHFLQERSRRLRVSTLFLLERVRPESTGGAKFERLRNSVPLWLQLLAALLLTWLLVEPRWIKEDSRQTVVVVLDSSVSMEAFKEPTRELLAEKLRGWSRAAARTEWHLLETDVRKPTLYTGSELAGVLKAYDGWKPVLGTHRPDEALQVGSGLVKEHGIVIFVTDRKAEVAAGVAVLSAGEEIENVGWAGVETTLVKPGVPDSGVKWSVLVRNYGKAPQTRQWWVEQEGSTEPKRSSLTLAPGQTGELGGELPPGVDRATLVLSGDQFTWDDRMPLQRPVERVVNLAFEASSAPGGVMKKMLQALDGVAVAPVTQNPDLTVAELGNPVNTDAVQILGGGGENLPLDGSYTVAEDHPLTRDLNWMSLLTPRPMELGLTERDEPLLWKGGRPLALIRHDLTATGTPVRRLLLAWDLSQSNAARHPALLVMLHRYVEQLRKAKREPWAGNFEAGQNLEVPAPLAASGAAPAALTLRRDDGTRAEFTGRVPDGVGFFDLEEGGKTMIRGAIHFADTREADFREAAPLDTVDARRWEAALKQTEADPLTGLWVLLVLGCLLGAWGWRSGPARSSAGSIVTVRS
ncbi:BatA domain-containing protein [Verrucomicrobium sp. BvORR034]|uniref:BatA domain-containing protein n=1 Tax=Verrucomicrobium sp. BvORR034 TaxID=1396418 RepID=UPI000678ACB3|nr:BatA domain-containing protein [Verrucomicrobium sp. BvORR034]